MKIAAAQTFVSKDISENSEIIRNTIIEAAKKDVRLINFCEGSLSGYAKSQISTPQEWINFDWASYEIELKNIADVCGQYNIFAVVGGVHRQHPDFPPCNSLFVFSNTGKVLARYDKRFLSNTEVNGYYTPGTEPVVFEIDSYKFGCAICIESQFQEVFMEYERMGVDAVLFSSYGIPEDFQIALRAHAGMNCIWISAATVSQRAHNGPAGIIDPNGKWIAVCSNSNNNDFVTCVVDRNAPEYDISLNKARPWRTKARLGDIYREKMIKNTDKNKY